MSSKFTSDGFIPQSRAAKVAGVEKAELVRLEVEVLKALEWGIGYRLEEVEDVSRGLLMVGEEMGLVEEIEPKGVLVMSEERELEQEDEEEDGKKRLLNAVPIPAQPAEDSPTSSSSSSQESVSAATEDETPPSSPPTSEEGGHHNGKSLLPITEKEIDSLTIGA